MPRQKKQGYRRVWYLTGFLLLLILSLLVYFLNQSSSKVDIESETVEEPVRELSAWVVDWHSEAGLSDLQELSSSLSSVQAFGVYFNHEDQLHVIDGFLESISAVMDVSEERGIPSTYLTIVNDRFNEDGTITQKDSALLTRLMATEQSRNQHIANIMQLVERHGVAGIEIDYERVLQEDWTNLILFLQQLYEQLQELDLSLRVVLEPRAPIEELKLPEGPDYVMMAYNLFGYHSGPGPKADLSFIESLTKRMESLPGNPYVALATGGFSWDGGEKATALTEQKAYELEQESIQPPSRDEESGSIYFDYVDENGEKHTVWYADGETLRVWIEAAYSGGITNIALWRLGEVSEETLQKLNRMMEVND
ncbi:glycosyl hydrolase family 18 protein [Bacillus horti]|uniref:Spore germination protein YaaH n=1 Tax=Caldalkalibacillus horti TaxID=77523 RepID=A0ABT9W2J8_9BACI|nr:glycosyl hydrolase family 18 protein [Bacillus horti]MDQ0167297.1 spore germination protein YaaH [Bacillus horti]